MSLPLATPQAKGLTAHGARWTLVSVAALVLQATCTRGGSWVSAVIYADASAADRWRIVVWSGFRGLEHVGTIDGYPSPLRALEGYAQLRDVIAGVR